MSTIERLYRPGTAVNITDRVLLMIGYNAGTVSDVHPTRGDLRVAVTDTTASVWVHHRHVTAA